MISPTSTAQEIPMDGAPGWMWRLEIEQQFGADPRLLLTIEKVFRDSDANLTLATLRDNDGKLAAAIMDADDGEPDDLAHEIMGQLLTHALERPGAHIVASMGAHVATWIAAQRARDAGA